MEQIRSFIAIELPEELKLGLEQLETQLKAAGQPWVRWVDPHSIHLTLKFLGNIDVDRIDEISRVMAEAAKTVSPFHLEVKDLGVFPNLRRIQVAWVGLTGEVDKLGQLQRGLESNLARLGFVPESRNFTPHLTLARVRNHASPTERQSFGQLIADTRFEAVKIEVSVISLMRSRLSREGAIHNRISLAKLKEPLAPETEK
jgi:2'-5' RNA ligase